MRVLLPMRDDDDAEDEAEAALRDRESLGDARVADVPACCAICSRARSTPAPSDDRAGANATTLRSRACGSTARCPRACSARSCAPVTSRLLRSWREGLREALRGIVYRPASRRIWYGAAPEHRRDVKIDPVIPLSVPLPEGTRDVALYGQTEALALVGGERMAVTLVTGTRAYLERDRLGAWLTHLALAASGRGANRPLATAVLAATIGWRAGAGRAEAGSRRLGRTRPARCSPGSPPSCSADVHQYLLPCEGVFTWRRRQRKGRR